MYQQADTTNVLGRRRWTSGLQGYVTSEALARRMPVQSARAPAGWTGLGQTAASRSTSPTPVGSPPYAAPPGLMWVWVGMPDVSAGITAVYPPAPMKIYYAWHLQKGPGFSATVLADYYRQNPSYMARDNVTAKLLQMWAAPVWGGQPLPLAPAAPLVTTPAAPVTVAPVAAAEVSVIDKLKAWLAEETIMAGYPNHWFVVGGVLAYFLLRKK